MNKGTWILLTIPLLALVVAVMGAYVDRITWAMTDSASIVAGEIQPGTQLGQRLTWHGDRWAPTLIVWAGISSASDADPQVGDYFSYEATPRVKLTVEANRAATAGEYFVFDIPAGYQVIEANDQDGAAVTLTRSEQRWYVTLADGTPAFSLLIERET